MVKKYNEIEAKDNMKVGVEVDNNEEVLESAEKKPLNKLINVQPKKVKRSLLGRLVTGVMGPEGLPGIGAYVNEEIIKPAIKNLIFDAITSAASRAMYGRNGGPSRPSNGFRHGGQAPKPAINYANMSNNSRPEPGVRKNVRSSRYGVEDYLIVDRHDASHVLTSLVEYADRYDRVSVADYYEAIGVPITEYTDNNHGWTIDSITHATIMPVQGGYIIKFPPVEAI